MGIQACGLHPLEISFKNHHLFQESHPLEEEVVFLFLTMFVCKHEHPHMDPLIRVNHKMVYEHLKQVLNY